VHAVETILKDIIDVIMASDLTPDIVRVRGQRGGGAPDIQHPGGARELDQGC
jgi:hypothetical protein